MGLNYGIEYQPRTQALWFVVSLSARGKAREGEKWKIRREAPGRIRIQNGGSVFCVIYIIIEMTLFTAKYGFVHCHYSLDCNI